MIKVYEYVAKHGSHNQASHAGSKGGKGGGGAGDDSKLAEGGVNMSVENHHKEAKGLEADIKADGGSSALSDVQNGHRSISGEMGTPITTKNSSPQDMRSSLKESATSLQAASKKLKTEGKDSLASRAGALAQKIITTHNNTPNY